MPHRRSTTSRRATSSLSPLTPVTDISDATLTTAAPTKTEMVVMARHDWEAMDKALALRPEANHAKAH